MIGKSTLSIALLLWIGLHTTNGTSSVATFADFLGVLTELLSVGNEFLSAVAEFAKLADKNKGSAQITIENYFNDTNLVDAQYHVASGSMDEIHFDVEGGEKQAAATSGPDLGQTEGLIGWNLPNSSSKVVVYWRVPHKSIILEQKSNKLGIGFVKNSNGDINWLKNLAGKGKDLAIPSIGMGEYASDGRTMQCCFGEICLQGLMSSNHHCEISIRVLPKKAARLFKSVNGLEEDQKFLDQVLNNQETCTSTSGAAAQGVFGGFIMLALTTIFLG
ncbi:uncharacterized protein [Watersipora subatra]|uniref:uncharacterized protein n=1 Tax=Watersipora subatra TaxID=2589382 RepID=UPI00355BB8D2